MLTHCVLQWTGYTNQFEFYCNVFVKESIIDASYRILSRLLVLDLVGFIECYKKYCRVKIILPFSDTFCG